MPDIDPTASDERSSRLQRYQHILLDYSRMASESSDVDSLLELTTVQAARGIGIKHTKIMRYRPEQGDFLLVAGVGWHPGVVGHTIPATDLGSAPGQALQTRQPVTVYDLPNDRQIRYPAVLKDHGIISALNVPVEVRGPS